MNIRREIKGVRNGPGSVYMPEKFISLQGRKNRRGLTLRIFSSYGCRWNELNSLIICLLVCIYRLKALLYFVSSSSLHISVFD